MSPNRMMVYRHWIEIRWALIPAAIFCLFMIPVGSGNALRWDTWLALPAHPFGPELEQTPLGESIGDAITVWVAFAGRIPFFGFATAWVLAGTGAVPLVRMESSGGASAIHTLTLPVSRARLVITRYVTALGVAVVAGILVASIGFLVVALRGGTIPAAAIAGSLALGGLYVATALATGGAIAAAMPRGFFLPSLFHVGLFVVALVPIHYLVASPARGDVPWGLAAGFLVTAGLSLALTVRWTTATEF